MKIPKTQVKAGGVKANHNQVLLPVHTQIRSGRGDDGAGGGPSIPNHNETLRVAAQVKAGIVSTNHNEVLRG